MAQFKNTANRTNSEYPSASAPYVPTTTSPVSNTTKVHLSGAKQVHEGDAARYHVELDLSPIGKANSSAALLKALSDLQGKGILFGQQHAIDEGISSADSHGHRSDVHAMTGKYPAVFGFDTDEPRRQPGCDRQGICQSLYRSGFSRLCCDPFLAFAQSG